VTTKPYASSSARNAKAIAGVLSHEFRRCRTVLEIGSGTGQHAVTFARELDHLIWQTSDLEPSHAGIREWIEESKLSNVREPFALDVLKDTVEPIAYDAVYSSNTAHIMSYAAVRRMFEIVGETLAENGVFCLYGPFSCGGKFSTTSNAEFDASLRARNASMGVRDLTELDTLACSNGMRLAKRYAMPANNLTIIWNKTGEG
jgi:cyclopropane fatty-acyl-phospholipid synthase-like methyltransferase